MVSISIMVVITVLIVTNQRGYNNTQILKNAADVLSLDLRTAQVYGLGVKESGAGTNDFSAAYGLAASTLPSPDAVNGYTLFTDTGVKDGAYTTSDITQCSAECLSRVQLPSGVTISAICIVRQNGADDCITAQRVDITFARPNPLPRIRWNNLYDLSSYPEASPRGIKIKLALSSGVERSVVLYTSGQISTL